jgi:pilus assembly protein CpaF
MGLLKRLVAENEVQGHEETLVSTPTSSQGTENLMESYPEMKQNIHRRLVEKLDLTQLDSISREELESQVREVVESLLANEADPAVGLNREPLVEEILHEVFGLGPLEPLLNDPTVADILVNTHKQVFVERYGRLELTNTLFKDDEHLMHIIDRIVSAAGRRVDESSPMVDARLPDGSRVNAIIPPLAIDGPTLSIRKFGVKDLTTEEMISYETLTAPMAELLSGAVKARLNILISGGTGSGKTTLLNVLSESVPANERIVTIEDAAELQLQQMHVIRLETRPANIEGQGEIIQRDLVRNALRMRPDRIIVGEVRGGEALDMLQAMNTGHDGSMTTLHANTPRDALRRLETMILMAGTNLPDIAMREQITSAIDVLIQIARLSDGTRKVIKISEITGMEGEVISMQDIFVFEKMGISEDGKVVGAFRATGIRPKFAERLKTSGIEFPMHHFEEGYVEPQEMLQ